ncbi:MAG: hypothetical protein AB7U52_01615 [Candidatus Izemoplasmatales bacterium]
MKKFKKPFKFYLLMFLILSLAVAGYSIYKIVKDATPVGELVSLWFLPLIFILIYYGSDSLMEKIFNKKKQVNYEEKFIEEIAKRMRESNEFLVEDYRRLQINDKFQESLKIGYQIYLNGESDLFNINKIERKFKKGTQEFKAIQYVIDYVRESKKTIE